MALATAIIRPLLTQSIGHWYLPLQLESGTYGITKGELHQNKSQGPCPNQGCSHTKWWTGAFPNVDRENCQSNKEV